LVIKKRAIALQMIREPLRQALHDRLLEGARHDTLDHLDRHRRSKSALGPRDFSLDMSEAEAADLAKPYSRQLGDQVITDPGAIYT